MFFIYSLRGAAGALPVPAHLSGMAVGRSSYGLQETVDAHPLCHLQLLAGKPGDLFINCLPSHAC